MRERLAKSRWFTRGWTLQELIAPRSVEFYSSDWRKIGDRHDLCDQLSTITGIDKHILLGGDLADVSVARKMSWASHRRTSRIEDMAYCLLGIFDINLPLIYGEGHKAFQRLQETIMDRTFDQSLFAWGRIVSQPAHAISEDQNVGLEPIPWISPEARQPLLGLFAQSPQDFSGCGDIGPIDHAYAHQISRKSSPRLLNGGVLIDLVIHHSVPSAWYWDYPPVAQADQMEHAILLCRVGDTENLMVGLVLHPWGDGYYSRTSELLLAENVFVKHRTFKAWTRTRHIMAHRPLRLRNADILAKRANVSFRGSSLVRPETNGSPVWRMRWGNRALRLQESAVGDEEVSLIYDTSNHEGFAITFMRLAQTTRPIGRLMVGMSPFLRRDGGRGPGNPIPAHSQSFRNPMFSRLMEDPVDYWSLEVEGRPRVYVRTERMMLDGGSGDAIHIVDLFVFPPADGTENPVLERVRKAMSAP